MKLEQYTRLKQLFVEAIDLDPERRMRFIDDVAGEDDSLATDLQHLLDADAGGPALYEVPDSLPERIGDYAIEGILGVGGMGVVYRAEQAHPHRTVALKVMRSEIATPGMLRRFEVEEDLLGRLAHPGIAQIYEAGTWSHDGVSTPFFAMEYVQGVTIVQHAHEHELSTHDRLRLLRDVCRVVEFAHRTGVIHRDLKPDNLLVDDEGQVKVLDFGVARAVGDDLQLTMQTEPGMLVGTLPYMSPEQLGVGHPSADTRSDVYALGVIGFEMLAGRLPHDLRGASLPQVVMTLRDTTAMSLGTIDHRWRGDIETIIAKALRVDADDRYQTAAALADDIDRCLEHKPIDARPATPAYFLRQFARRHRGLVSVAATAALLLFATSVIAVSMAIRAQQQTAVARTESRRLGAVNEFVTSLWDSFDVRQAIAGATVPPREVRLADVLQDAAANLSEGYQGQPVVEADLRMIFAEGFQLMGMPEHLLEQQRVALALRQSSLEEGHRDTIASMLGLAATLLNRGKKEESDRLSQTALVLVRTHHPDDAELLVPALSRMMDNAFDAFDLELSEVFANEAIMIARADLPLPHPARMAATNNLAYLRLRQGRPEAAEVLFLEVVDAYTREFGPQSRASLHARDNLTNALRTLGRSDEAAAIEREVLDGYITLFGEDSGAADWVRSKLAMLLTDIGEYDEAIEHAEISLDWRRASYGDEHDLSLTALGNLTLILERAGENDRAEPLVRQALNLFEAKYGSDHELTNVRRLSLARLLVRRGEPQPAEALFAIAAPRFAELFGSDHWRTINACIDHARCLVDLGRYEEAEQSLETQERITPKNRAVYVGHRLARGYVYLYDAWGRSDTAAMWQAKLPN